MLMKSDSTLKKNNERMLQLRQAQVITNNKIIVAVDVYYVPLQEND